MTKPETQPTVRAPAAGGAGRVLRTLKDGYWDRTEVVQLDDGSLRVRKSSKGDAPPGPWGVAALRKEIEYLSTLPERARAVFPPILAAWDDTAAESPRVGYEVPFYADHVDAGQLAREGALAQVEIDLFQGMLAEALLERVHVPRMAEEQAEEQRRMAYGAAADPELATGRGQQLLVHGVHRRLLLPAAFLAGAPLGVSRRQQWTTKAGEKKTGSYRYYQCESRTNQSACAYNTQRAAELEARVREALREDERPPVTRLRRAGNVDGYLLDLVGQVDRVVLPDLRDPQDHHGCAVVFPWLARKPWICFTA